MEEKNQGEGNREADRRYRRGVRETVEEPTEEERARRYRMWKKAVTKSLDWVDDDARTLMGTTGP